jgi:hypothetical protein
LPFETETQPEGLEALPDRPYCFLLAGLGVDSTALLILTLTDPRFENYKPDFVVFSDTGSEMPYTYSLILSAVNLWLAGQNYRNLDGSEGVIVLDCHDPRYRSPSRLGDIAEWHMHRRKPGIPTKTLRSCTDGAKVTPFRRFVNAQKDLRLGKWKAYGQRHQVLIGIAADEAERSDNAISLVPNSAKYLEHRFSLVEFGITKAECARILEQHAIPAYKSACYQCPFQPVSKFWAVRELYPQLHARSVAMEELAAARNPRLRLLGREGVSLDQEIERWIERQLKKQGQLPDPWQVLTSHYHLRRCWSDRALTTLSNAKPKKPRAAKSRAA